MLTFFVSQDSLEEHDHIWCLYGDGYMHVFQALTYIICFYTHGNSSWLREIESDSLSLLKAYYMYLLKT